MRSLNHELMNMKNLEPARQSKLSPLRHVHSFCYLVSWVNFGLLWDRDIILTFSYTDKQRNESEGNKRKIHFHIQSNLASNTSFCLYLWNPKFHTHYWLPSDFLWTVAFAGAGGAGLSRQLCFDWKLAQWIFVTPVLTLGMKCSQNHFQMFRLLFTCLMYEVFQGP